MVTQQACCQGCGTEHGWTHTCEELEEVAAYYSSGAPEVIADRQRRVLAFWERVQQKGSRPIPEGILAQLNENTS